MWQDAQHSTYHPATEDRDDRPLADEEDEMHVLHSGHWHRELVGTSALNMTACGKEFQLMYTPRRQVRLEGPLCEECFTPAEIIVAERNEAALRYRDGAAIGPDLSDIPRRRKP